MTNTNPKWDDNVVQFARLIAEIAATQDTLDHGALCESMDLSVDDLNELFERADDVWERAKGNRPEDFPGEDFGHPLATATDDDPDLVAFITTCTEAEAIKWLEARSRATRAREAVARIEARRTEPTDFECWCGEPATQLVDSDSINFADGMPVCDEHAEGLDPHEARIV